MGENNTEVKENNTGRKEKGLDRKGNNLDRKENNLDRKGIVIILIFVLIINYGIAIIIANQVKDKITVTEREYIGGFAGTEYTKKATRSVHIDKNYKTIYNNGTLEVKAKYASSDKDAVVLEFSDEVYVVQTSQKITNELLSKGNTLIINYPIGNGGIELNIKY